MTEDKQAAVEKAEEILAPYFTHDDWSGGLRRFDNAPWHKVQAAMLVSDFLADYAPWNSFIGTLELIKEAGKLEQMGCEVLYHGYLVGNNREDSRLSLEGLAAYSDNIGTLALASARGAQLNADEFGIQGNACVWWWD
jgi:hypothetical protein